MREDGGVWNRPADLARKRRVLPGRRPDGGAAAGPGDSGCGPPPGRRGREAGATAGRLGQPPSSRDEPALGPGRSRRPRGLGVGACASSLGSVQPKRCPAGY